jgi:hypothetical protein
MICRLKDLDGDLRLYHLRFEIANMLEFQGQNGVKLSSDEAKYMAMSERK